MHTAAFLNACHAAIGLDKACRELQKCASWFSYILYVYVFFLFFLSRLHLCARGFTSQLVLLPYYFASGH